MVKGIENIATKADLADLHNEISKLNISLLKWVFFFGTT